MLETPSEPLAAEDAKLVTLARAARARIGALEGAAVRDGMGRTYAGAVAAGADTLEAAAVVTEASSVDGPGYAAVRDLNPKAPVHAAAPDGTLLGTISE
jgi:hypothetical protein